MRTVLLGTLIVAGLVMAATGMLSGRGEAFAEHNGPQWSASPSGDLIALSTVVDSHYQQLTVIDPKQRVICVYHVDLASGQIVLKNVRTIHWDLQMIEFNGDAPLPQEIQSLLEQR